MSTLNVVITCGATATRFAARDARVACLDLHPDVPEPLLGVEAGVTDDAAADPDAERAALAGRQPTGLLVTVDEVAIAYLASPESGAVTGTALAVDGGMHGPRPRT